MSSSTVNYVEDKIGGSVAAWDRYAYVENNPLRYTDPSGHFTEDAIRQYLLAYYGDEGLALRTLQLWKQDREWWEMIRLAEGGDHLLGYQWFISGNPSRPTGGDSKQFNVAFIGMGQDNLAGLEGLDLVAVWSGSVVEMGQRWNVEWEGILSSEGTRGVHLNFQLVDGNYYLEH